MNIIQEETNNKDWLPTIDPNSTSCQLKKIPKGSVQQIPTFK